jgi:GT2 family glycosyltransferase
MVATTGAGMQDGRVAVVVLNWNGPGITADCLRSLIDAKVAPSDIILVDNGSTDDSVARFRDEFPGVTLLALPRNTGYTGGNNAGIAHVLEKRGHEFVLILNNDTLVPDGLVPRLVAQMDAHPEAGIVQPRVVSFDRTTVDNAGFECDRNGATWPRGRDLDPAATYDATSFFYASGACMLVRASVLRHVGGFDERYFMYNEDVDFSWRVRLAGWQLRLVDTARCYHAESTTAGTTPTKIGVIWRNRFATLFKNYGPLRLATRVPLAVLGTGVFAAATAVRQRNFRFILLYLTAVGWNVRHLPSTLRERRRVQSLRRVQDRDLDAFWSPSVEWRMVRERFQRELRVKAP